MQLLIFFFLARWEFSFSGVKLGNYPEGVQASVLDEFHIDCFLSFWWLTFLMRSIYQGQLSSVHLCWAGCSVFCLFLRLSLFEHVMKSTDSRSPEVRLQSNLSLCSFPGESGQRNPGLQGLSSHSQGQGNLWYRASRSHYLWALLHVWLWRQAGETEPGGGKKFLLAVSCATAYVSFVVCIRTTYWNPGHSEGPFDCTLRSLPSRVPWGPQKPVLGLRGLQRSRKGMKLGFLLNLFTILT